MGQPQSSEEGGYKDARKTPQDETVPYTKYSQSKPISTGHKPSPPSTVRGITVVNPKPEHDLKNYKPLELQKLDKIHRFWPILKSSLSHNQPTEKISDGLEYMDVLSMCTRYQDHLQDTAIVVSIEQKALASRLKDLEMFSAGVAQQIIRRQERMQRALLQLEKVKEVSSNLEAIHASIEECVPLMHKLNHLLPESERLEPFELYPPPSQEEEEFEEEEKRVGGGGEGEVETGGETEEQWEICDEEPDNHSTDVS